MAQLIGVKLSRFDGSPWGFRLQGGKDFGTPLIVQKVNGGSLAEQAGLRAGDAVIRVNSTDMFNLRHKDAQDVIVRSGNSFEMTVQRGGSTWRPSVSPVSASLPSPQPSAPASCVSPVTKTSLAAKKQDAPLIGSGHNFSPKPFLNGGSDGPIKSIVNKQYNSPVGIYSEETIAETLSAQAEVLAGGVLGVNFKKNERNYNAENSEVFKMVQEADKEPKTPEPAEPVVHSGVVTPSSPALTGLRSVQAPETKPQPTTPQSSLPPGQNICADCERLIVGVFVRIKDKNLHVECFKCSTCGTSLKNVGYYNINNKLYCDIHAKLVARQQAPSGMTPITVPPGGKAPAGTISAALSSLGGSGPLSPPLNSHSSPQAFSARLERRSSGDLGSPPRRLSRIEQPIYCESTRTISSNGARGIYDESDSYSREDPRNGRTYTSTITFRTGNEVGRSADVTSDVDLDDNRNPTNKALHESDLSFVHSPAFAQQTFVVSSSLSPPKSLESSRLNDAVDSPKKSFVVSSTLCPLKWSKNGSPESEKGELEKSVNELTIGGVNGWRNGNEEKRNESNLCDDHEAPVVNTFDVPRYHVTNHRLKMGTYSAYNRFPESPFSTSETPGPQSPEKLIIPEELRSREALEISNAIFNHRYRSIGRRLGNNDIPGVNGVEKTEANGTFVRSASLRLQNGNGKYKNGGSDEETGKDREIPGYRFLATNGRHLPIVSGLKNSVDASENLFLTSKRPTTDLTTTAQPFSSHTSKLSHTSNNISGPKPFGGSSIIAPSNYSSPPVQNSGSNTLPRPQTQTVTGSGFGGSGPGGRAGKFAGSTAPKRGRGILNQAGGPGSRQPLCAHCSSYVRGPFITALGQIWCPEHFVCVNSQCRRALQDIGFVEEKGQLHCEYCFERFIAPGCDKCNNKIKGDCLNAVGKHFHPECFNCSYCGKLFGNSPFFLEDGLPYCEADWNELFTTKCYACGFPVEAGDRWVEALNNNYHSQCFNCTMCKTNLEGQSFYAKGGRPFCKNHAR